MPASGCQKGALAGGSAKATEGTDTGEGRRRRRNRSENAAPTLAHSKNSAALLALQRICSTAPFPKVTETPEALQNKAAQRSDAKRSQTAASLPNCLIAAIAIMRFSCAIIDKLSYPSSNSYRNPSLAGPRTPKAPRGPLRAGASPPPASIGTRRRARQ